MRQFSIVIKSRKNKAEHSSRELQAFIVEISNHKGVKILETIYSAVFKL